MAAKKALEIRVFLDKPEPIERLANRLDKGEGTVSVVVLLKGREVEVRLPGQYRVTPQVAGAIKAVPGIVDVRIL
jgi:DNA polymerase-3 subunit alpha